MNRIVDILCHPLNELYLRHSKYDEDVDLMVKHLIWENFEPINRNQFTTTFAVEGREVDLWTSDETFPYAYGYVFAEYNPMLDSKGCSIRTAHKLK